MSIITSPTKSLMSSSKAISLVLAAVVAAAIFAAAALAAPPLKPRSVVMESGSGSLQALGFGVTDSDEFVYDEVRHVSLTLGYYSDSVFAQQADLFAGPVWADEVRSKAFWTTTFPPMHAEDDFDYLETQTVEFDADRWKIELINLSGPEKYVRYNYTVTFPKS
jgi:opacity protein-like surface antigen